LLTFKEDIDNELKEYVEDIRYHNDKEESLKLLNGVLTFSNVYNVDTKSYIEMKIRNPYDLSTNLIIKLDYIEFVRALAGSREAKCQLFSRKGVENLLRLKQKVYLTATFTLGTLRGIKRKDQNKMSSIESLANDIKDDKWFMNVIEDLKINYVPGDRVEFEDFNHLAKKMHETLEKNSKAKDEEEIDLTVIYSRYLEYTKENLEQPLKVDL
jgi:hypothetical protein